MGNLLGDFVKGNPEGRFHPSVVEGIKLHRFVDSYTDRHPLTAQAKLLFAREKRRYAPIALDMFWDHALACRFDEYHPVSLEQFSQSAMRTVLRQAQQTEQPLPERFMRVANAMHQGQWLSSYQELDNIRFALSRIAQRSPRMTPLAQCGEDLSRESAHLMAIFDQLYSDVLNAAQSF